MTQPTDLDFDAYQAFMGLPHARKRALAARFDLFTPDERGRSEEMQCSMWLIRAKYKGILSDVLAAAKEPEAK